MHKQTARKSHGNLFGYALIPMLMLCLVMTGGCESSGGGGGSSSSSHDFGDNNPMLVVAIGDSITEGGYPGILDALTDKAVVNLGHGGDRSSDGAAIANHVLGNYRPGYLLILYGANDIIHGVDPNQILANLQSIIQTAHAHQTIPVIANLTPAYGVHSYMLPGITSLNPAIKALAKQENARFVNLYSAFGSNQSLIQGDGLHPTPAGNYVIAESFLPRID